MRHVILDTLSFVTALKLDWLHHRAFTKTQRSTQPWDGEEEEGPPCLLIQEMGDEQGGRQGEQRAAD